nr:hypothetical protein CFP56_72526 [Quercus suber]
MPEEDLGEGKRDERGRWTGEGDRIVVWRGGNGDESRPAGFGGIMEWTVSVDVELCAFDAISIGRWNEAVLCGPSGPSAREGDRGPLVGVGAGGCSSPTPPSSWFSPERRQRTLPGMKLLPPPPVHEPRHSPSNAAATRGYAVFHNFDSPIISSQHLDSQTLDDRGRDGKNLMVPNLKPGITRLSTQINTWTGKSDGKLVDVVAGRTRDVFDWVYCSITVPESLAWAMVTHLAGPNPDAGSVVSSAQRHSSDLLSSSRAGRVQKSQIPVPWPRPLEADGAAVPQGYYDACTDANVSAPAR